MKASETLASSLASRHTKVVRTGSVALIRPELVTDADLKKLASNGKVLITGSKVERARLKPVSRLFNPWGVGTWLLLGTYPDLPHVAYALAEMGGEMETGDVDLVWLSDAKFSFGLRIERERMWRPTSTFTQYVEEANRGRRF